MKIVFLLPLAIILASCQSNGTKCDLQKKTTTRVTDKISVVTIFDECSGKLKLKQEVLSLDKDSVIPNGFYYDYYKNGKIRTIGHFKMGIQDSIGIRYDESGNKSVQNYYSDGKLWGVQYSYYPTGKIKEAHFMDNSDQSWCDIAFDTNEHVTSLMGYPLRLRAEPGFNSLSVGEDFAIINEVIVIPNSSTRLTVKLSQGEEVVWDTVVNKFLHIDNAYFSPIVRTLHRNGHYQYEAKVDLIDKNDSLISTCRKVEIINVK